MKTLLALLVVTGACGGVAAQDEQPLAWLDLDAYARDVHPILEARCATLDCHGVDDRPLRLYAETGLRARDDLRDLAIEGAELEANVRAMQSIDPGADPSDTLLVRKPLDGAGGVAHEGGTVWASRDEPQLVCLLAWLSGTSGEPDASAACAVAADEVALPPE
ncbi:MAG TPA: hypothetical protein VFU21_11890 [Kofleriaceae bacterium]|nr:hypothetical protein [Kofleriaceae bacterium]